MNKGKMWAIIFTVITVIVVAFIAYKTWAIVLTFILMGMTVIGSKLK